MGPHDGLSLRGSIGTMEQRWLLQQLLQYYYYYYQGRRHLRSWEGHVPTTFAGCTTQGVQPNLRCTHAGYYSRPLKLRNSHSVLALGNSASCSRTVCHTVYEARILNFALLENQISTKVKFCYLFISKKSNVRKHLLFFAPCSISTQTQLSLTLHSMTKIIFVDYD